MTDLTPAEVRAEGRRLLAEAELGDLWDIFGYNPTSRVARAVAEVREHRAADGRLNAIAEWAIDADHHPGCSGWDPHYRCKCGRRDLFPEEADRD